MSIRSTAIISQPAPSLSFTLQHHCFNNTQAPSLSFIPKLYRLWSHPNSTAFVHTHCFRSHQVPVLLLTPKLHQLHSHPSSIFFVPSYLHTLCFPSLNTILIRRILLSEPCTIILRMCSSGLSYSVSQCVLKCFNVLFFFVIHSNVRHVRLTCVY